MMKNSTACKNDMVSWTVRAFQNEVDRFCGICSSKDIV